jgi:hypothetical protein
MKTYMNVLTTAVRDHPNTFVNFKFGDRIGLNGRREIAAAIQASNEANHRADPILEARKDVDGNTVYVNYQYQ